MLLATGRELAEKGVEGGGRASVWRPAGAAARGEAEVSCPVPVHRLRSVLVTSQECCGSCAGGVLVMAGPGSKSFRVSGGWREACGRMTSVG